MHRFKKPRLGQAYALVSATAVCLAAACSPVALPEAPFAKKVAPLCDGAGVERHFGELRLPPDRSTMDWAAPVARMLDAMREPPFSCGAGSNSYRVVWVHSFSGGPEPSSRYPPTAVRISEKNGIWTVTGVQLASSVNRTETLRRQRALSEIESRELLEAVAKFQLWRRQDFEETDGLDGELWIVEARRANGYQTAFLANADRDACRRLAAAFFKAAGIDPRVLDGRVDSRGVVPETEMRKEWLERATGIEPV